MSKEKRKIKYGKITLDLLKIIAGFGEDFFDCFVDQQKIKRKIKNCDTASMRLLDYLRNLNNSGYIELKIKTVKGKNKLLSVKLTNKGRLKLLEDPNEERVDGRWRLLSFDVPEKLKTKRNSFRCAIKRIGFRQVQKSLWACPFIKADQIELAINKYHLDKYVAYLVVSKTDIELHLKSLFKDVLTKKIRNLHTITNERSFESYGVLL